jgi:hypothetical protein
VRLLRSWLVGAAEADVRADRDDRRPVVRLGGLDRRAIAVDVVAVLDRWVCQP